MIAEQELTPLKVVKSIANCLELGHITGGSPKEQKNKILDELGLRGKAIPGEVRHSWSPPNLEEIKQALSTSLESGNYAFVRLTLPGMETLSGGLYVTQLLSPQDLTESQTEDDLVFKAVKTGAVAQLSTASTVELFVRPRSTQFEVLDLNHAQKKCSLGGGFTVTIMNFVTDQDGRLLRNGDGNPLINLQLDATLEDTSKRVLFDGHTPQLTQLLTLPINSDGLVFPELDFYPDQTQITTDEIVRLIASQVLGKKGPAVSKLFGAMAEIYPQPGGNQIAGIYCTQLNEGKPTMTGYLSDFDSLEMPLSVVEATTAKAKSIGRDKIIVQPDTTLPQYTERKNFYLNFRETPLAEMIHVVKASIGYNFSNGG